MPIWLPSIFAIFIIGITIFAPPTFAEQLSTQQLQALIEKAEQGDMQAQSNLANRYYLGEGITQDVKLAALWYEKLANNGVAEAQLTLGLIYIRGEGVKQDNAKALHWLNLAAEQRLPMAQYLLGLAHEEGHGLEVDKVKAYMWYEISAAMDNNKNSVDARSALAKQMNQEEITQAEAMATEWWMKFHH